MQQMWRYTISWNWYLPPVNKQYCRYCSTYTFIGSRKGSLCPASVLILLSFLCFLPSPPNSLSLIPSGITLSLLISTDYLRFNFPVLFFFFKGMHFFLCAGWTLEKNIFITNYLHEYCRKNLEAKLHSKNNNLTVSVVWKVTCKLATFVFWTMFS